MDKTLRAFPAIQGIDLSRSPGPCIPCKGEDRCSWIPLIGRPRCQFATIQEFLDAVTNIVHTATTPTKQ